ncbi:MAG: glycosyltransferase family 4 protein [Acidobacteria bacterium]|nr:glycosyltransferase family 4 protein [Acidobacteriota bacterium]
MTKRLKVLVEAYECSPARGHVPGSAWRIVKGLSEYYDIHVLTEARYEEEIREYLRKNGASNGRLNFHFIPRPQSRIAKGHHSPLPLRAMLRYRRWLERSFETASTLCTRNAFDLAHHLRADTFREPGYLWKLELPFIWGPMGGTGRFPWSMMPVLGIRNQAAHSIKNILNAVQFRASRRVIRAIRSARIIAQTREDRRNLLRIHGVNACVVHEQAADPSLGRLRRLDDGKPLQIVWAGRCLELKGIPILLRALQSGNLRKRALLHFAGDGPELLKWQQLAGRLGVADAIVWHGWLSQDQTLALLHKCHMAVFPSLLEATSTFVMQSLSTGLPVVCLDHCGFGDIIDDTCGIKIPVSNPGSVVAGFSRALETVTRNPQLVERLSRGAMQCAQQFSWANTVSAISGVYEKAAGVSAESETDSTVTLEPKAVY